METDSQKAKTVTGKPATEEVAPGTGFYAALLDSCAEAIALVDQEGLIVYQNRLLFSLTGFTAAETTGRSLFNLVHPADQDAVKSFVTFLQTEAALPEQLQLRVLHKEDHYLWIMVTATNLLNNPDVGAIMLSCRDITQSKQTEKKLEEAHRELNKLFNNINDVLFSVDMVQYKLMQVSPACEKIYGYTAIEFLSGEDDLWQQVVYEPDRPNTELQLSCLYEGKVARTEYRIINKDGSLHWIENVVIPSLDESGKLVRIDGVSRDITERKQAEQALRDNQVLLKEFFESAPEAIIVADLDTGEFVDCNANAVAIFGCSREELLAKKPGGNSPLYQPDGILSETHVKEHIKRVQAGEKIVFDWQHVDAAGNPFYSEVRLTRLNIPGRNLTRASIISISDRINAREAILKSKANLRSLLDSAAVSYVLLDKELCVVAFNKPAIEWSRSLMNVELQLGANYVDSLPNPLRATAQTNFAMVMGGTIRDYETYIPDANGDKFWYHVRMYPINDENGNLQGMGIAVSNTTQRKEAESKLLESEEKYRSLFDNMREAIAYCEMVYENDKPVDFIYRTVNQRFSEFSGLYDVIGKRVSELIPGFIEDHTEELEAYHRVIKTGCVEKFETYATALGLWLDITIYQREGNHFVSVFSVINDRKDTEARIMAMNESLEKKVAERTNELAEANKELEAFSYTVSHDLQAPLRLIDGFAKSLYKDYKDKLDGNGIEYLKHISQGVVRMSRLTRDLLAFARLGKVPVTKKNVDMGLLVNTVIEEINLANPGKNIPVKVESLVVANCDEDLIKQVWVNLIQNAVKYSSKKEHPKIEIGLTAVNSMPAYYVKDNGAGFDMKYAHKLFGVFKRLHNESEFTGHGVGLALVHRIIVRHGGKIWAEGKVNEGATFYFTLP